MTGRLRGMSLSRSASWFSGMCVLPSMWRCCHSPGVRTSSTNGASGSPIHRVTAAPGVCRRIGDEIVAVLQCTHAFVQITGHIVEADAAEPCGCLRFSSRRGDNDDRACVIEKGACPGGVLAAKADVDAASQVSWSEVARVAHVERLRAVAIIARTTSSGNGFNPALEDVVECLVFFRVQHRVVGEVRRRIGLVGCDQLDELVLAHRLQRVVRRTLLSDRRHGLFADLLSAQRSRAVCRIHSVPSGNAISSLRSER